MCVAVATSLHLDGNEDVSNHFCFLIFVSTLCLLQCKVVKNVLYLFHSLLLVRLREKLQWYLDKYLVSGGRVGRI